MKKHLARFLLTGVSLALIAAMAVPVIAQEGEAPAGPGEGGVLIAGDFGGDPGTFNPFYCGSTSCQDEAIAFMYPGVVGTDPATATFQKGADGALALDWTISEDGTVYTFTIRQDFVWTDGTPVTAYDIEWAWDVNANPEANTQDSWLVEYVADVVALDDYTLQVTFTSSGCNVIRYTPGIYGPKHILESVPVTELETHPYSTNPDVTAGVFKFGEYRSGEQFSLLANQDFPDAIYGYVVPAGRIVKQVPDQTVMIQQFLAGELSEMRNVPPNYQDDFRAAAEAGDIQVYEYGGNTWDYLGFNMADPTNPVNGLDEEGNPLDQGHHPLFGDARVRKAIAMAIDVDAIVEGAVFGNGTRMPSSIVAASWAIHPDLDPIAYDPEAAKALLEEAGWRDEDGDGVLEAHGAMYASDGTPFKFTLYTNQGNTRREAIGTIVQDQLKQLGIEVDYQAIEWNTLLDINDSQEYDAVIMGWRAGYPDDPIASISQIFGAFSDQVGACSNCGSYYNPEVYDLLEQANSVEGCDLEAMKPYLYQVQEIMQEDLPYVWLYSINGMYSAQNNVVNFSPYPSQMYWNVDAWALTPE